jgi:hypothetical protein
MEELIAQGILAHCCVMPAALIDAESKYFGLYHTYAPQHVPTRFQTAQHVHNCMIGCSVTPCDT